MRIETTPIEGLLIIEPTVHKDDRGYFMESYNKLVLESKGNVHYNFVQDNQARSVKNVLRGLHYQNDPAAQVKLIRVLEGSIWDVAVDIRKNSKTYKKWFGIELTAENKLQLLIPYGFAHGYAVLSDTAEVFYKCDRYYNKSAEGGIFFGDNELAVDWKMNVHEAIISDKDLKQPLLKDCWNCFE